VVLLSDGRGRLGQSENHVEVWSGQQLGISLLEPFEASLPLALGTMAVATGAVTGVRVLAVVTKLDDTAQRFCAADFDGVHHTAVMRR
jgi:hypothetical protein